MMRELDSKQVASQDTAGSWLSERVSQLQAALGPDAPLAEFLYNGGFELLSQVHRQSALLVI